MFYSQNNMDFKLVLLMGMPRSGTSWLSQIFDSHPNVNFKLSPLFSYAFKNVVDQDSSKIEWIDFFKQVYKSNDRFINQQDRRDAAQYPVFKDKLKKPEYLAIKDTRYHNLIDTIIKLFNDVKIIYIVRNPCGAINSWLKTKKEFPETADVDTEWRTGDCRKTGPEEFWGFDDWVKLTNYYLDLANKYPKKIMIIKYKDLVDLPIEQTEKMFNFVGFKISSQTVDFLKKCNSKHSINDYSVYKSKKVKDKWKKELDPKIIKEILEKIKGTKLKQFIE